MAIAQARLGSRLNGSHGNASTMRCGLVLTEQSLGAMKLKGKMGWRNTPGDKRTTCWQIFSCRRPSNCVLLRVCLLSFIGLCPMPQPASDAGAHAVTNKAYFQKCPVLVYVSKVIKHKASSEDFGWLFQLGERPRTDFFSRHDTDSPSSIFLDVPARLIIRCMGSGSGKRCKRLTAMRTNGSRDPGRKH